jgi:two-component system OmpR family response regulator
MTHHILIVDDEPGMRTFLTSALEDAGFAVATAVNGREALLCVAEDQPELVLLDLNMPVMSGWEVLDRLREAERHVPVVVMTAGNRAAAPLAGQPVDGYLAKPFDLDTLLDVVDRLT